MITFENSRCQICGKCSNSRVRVINDHPEITGKTREWQWDVNEIEQTFDCRHKSKSWCSDEILNKSEY